MCLIRVIPVTFHALVVAQMGVETTIGWGVLFGKHSQMPLQKKIQVDTILTSTYYISAMVLSRVWQTQQFTMFTPYAFLSIFVLVVCFYVALCNFLNTRCMSRSVYLSVCVSASQSLYQCALCLFLWLSLFPTHHKSPTSVLVILTLHSYVSLSVCLSVCLSSVHTPSSTLYLTRSLPSPLSLSLYLCVSKCLFLLDSPCTIKCVRPRQTLDWNILSHTRFSDSPHTTGPVVPGKG